MYIILIYIYIIKVHKSFENADGNVAYKIYHKLQLVYAQSIFMIQSSLCFVVLSTSYARDIALLYKLKPATVRGITNSVL